MNITLKEIIKLAKELPESTYAEAYEKLKELSESNNNDEETGTVGCVACGSVNISKNGKRHGKQAYMCKDCGKSFVETSGAAIAYSHSSESVWRQVINDTVDGISIDKTAENLDLSHVTVFNMRHKILKRLEDEFLSTQKEIAGISEADETYVLESLKGKKIPEDYHRGSRKHGAKASKPGISNEYICVCTSVDEDDDCMAVSVNRATPSKAEIEQIFGDKVTPETVILCDGNQNYDVLEDKCTVAHTKRVNKVNGFHSFIKERLLKYRGVATAYLNRYNALFAWIFGDKDTITDKIFELMKSRDNSFRTIIDIKSNDLLDI